MRVKEELLDHERRLKRQRHLHECHLAGIIPVQNRNCTGRDRSPGQEILVIPLARSLNGRVDPGDEFSVPDARAAAGERLRQSFGLGGELPPRNDRGIFRRSRRGIRRRSRSRSRLARKFEPLRGLPLRAGLHDRERRQSQIDGSITHVAEHDFLPLGDLAIQDGLAERQVISLFQRGGDRLEGFSACLPPLVLLRLFVRSLFVRSLFVRSLFVLGRLVCGGFLGTRIFFSQPLRSLRVCGQLPGGIRWWSHEIRRPYFSVSTVRIWFISGSHFLCQVIEQLRLPCHDAACDPDNHHAHRQRDEERRKPSFSDVRDFLVE